MPLLDGRTLRLIQVCRTATLATIAPDGSARLVPVCYAVIAEPAEMPRLYTPLDEKPKSGSDPLALARVRDISERPRVTLLLDHWDEDWSRLAWLRLSGVASLLEPGPSAGLPTAVSTEHAAAVGALRARYSQYVEMALERRPMIRVALDGARAWWASAATWDE
jgi:PPOX class probable F420-dependent enzyme